jgi:hypothetical protein
MSEKKLFQVNVDITIDMVIAAESKEEAERYAQENYRDELRETAYPGVMAYAPRKPLSHCPPDWNGCPPYNSDDDRTVDEWFKEPSDLPQVP